MRNKEYDLKSDLTGRTAEQALEILAVSGPRAQAVMRWVRDGKLKAIRQLLEDTGAKFSDDRVGIEACCRIFQKYGKLVLSAPKWQ